MGVRVVGVSADDPATIDRFAREKGDRLHLVADPESELIAAFDVGRPDSPRAERSTYVIGGDGAIVLAYRKVKARGHAAAVLEDVRAAREQGRL